MGTRIHVFLTHDLPRFDDRAATLARLEAALPAVSAVREYWRSVDPDHNGIDRWHAQPVTPVLPDIRRYTGPGSLYLWVTPAAARIDTGGRWRGFLSIEPLRRVHIAAFRAIAESLHSPTLAICHDSCEPADEAFLANGSQDQCIARLRATLGPPQRSLEFIAAEIIKQAEHRVPNVWYLDGQSAAD